MTYTVRDLATRAVAALKGIAPGDDLVVDELNSVLVEARDMLIAWHGRRGPLRDVDIEADYVAGENERVRVQDSSANDADAPYSVTLPNSINTMDGSGSLASASNLNSPTDQPSVTDFGFASSQTLRQPRDGTRIEIVGEDLQSLYFYAADTNTWVSVYDLTLDSPLPVNATQIGDWAALLAQRMIDTWPGLYEPTPNLMARIGRARASIFLRPGVNTDPTVGEYF